MKISNKVKSIEKKRNSKSSDSILIKNSFTYTYVHIQVVQLFYST